MAWWSSPCLPCAVRPSSSSLPLLSCCRASERVSQSVRQSPQLLSASPAPPPQRCGELTADRPRSDPPSPLLRSSVRSFPLPSFSVISVFCHRSHRNRRRRRRRRAAAKKVGLFSSDFRVRLWTRLRRVRWDGRKEGRKEGRNNRRTSAGVRTSYGPSCRCSYMSEWRRRTHARKHRSARRDGHCGGGVAARVNRTGATERERGTSGMTVYCIALLVLLLLLLSFENKSGRRHVPRRNRRSCHKSHKPTRARPTRPPSVVCTPPLSSAPRRL